MRHTEQQVTEALALMGISNRTHAKALEAQLRADNPGAWFIIAGRRLRAQREAEGWDDGSHRCYGPCTDPIHRG